MHHSTIRDRLIRVCLIALFFALNTPAPFASAQSISQTAPGQTFDDEAHMEIHISFPQNQIQALWHVEAKRTFNGSVINEVTAEPIQLTCWIEGVVQFADESARFNTQQKGYIACRLPSFREMVHTLTVDWPDGPVDLAQTCLCKNAWIAANVQLDNSNWQGSAPYQNPIFHHPDFQYYMPFIRDPTTSYLHMQYAGVPAPNSTPFNLEDWNAVWSGIDGAEFLANLGPWAAYLLQHDLTHLADSVHWANGKSLSPAEQPSAFRLSTDETIIYVGHSPVSDTYADIVVKNVDWDPPCFGIGP